MSRSGFVVALLAALLATAAAVPVAAQDPPASPEGIGWHLVNYSADGGSVPVSWLIDATLVLEDGQASGNNGCNTFGGAYSRDGDALSFDDIVMTLMACADEAATVEQGYMSNLPATATWSISDDRLELADAEGSVILTFEQAVSGLTASDLAAIADQLGEQQGQIDRLVERLGNVQGSVLRDRISELEGEVAVLQGQIKALTPASPTGSSGSFNAAEQILLEGIPKPIRSTCSPRRSENPSGTLAAVQCKPDSPLVRDMAYYLMTAKDATDVFNQRMAENGVRGRSKQCRDGVSSMEADVPGPGVVGCYVNADGRASLRIVAPASGCNQLTVGSRTIPIPAIYVAVLGNNDDMRRLTRWRATDPLQPGLTQEISRPDAPISPRCPS